MDSSPTHFPDEQPTESLTLSVSHKRRKRVLALLLVALLLLLSAVSWWLYVRESAPSKTQKSTTPSSAAAQTTERLELDPAKNYGNKYNDGVLPVGDEKYVTDAAKKGYIYLCRNNFLPASQAGAQTRGPWFNGTTTWNVNKKYAVLGSVVWNHSLRDSIESSKRIITTNGLPDHVTGVFPVSSSDPAYQYDRNPNSIKSQSFTYTLASSPTYGGPQCMSGEVGVMLSGVALFNGFDAGGRDAGAWEIQDGCEGHPQGSGIYHYHTLSSCLNDVSVSTVIGFALDGFPITGPKIGENNLLTTDDLDECHGITSGVTLDGKKVKTYHYVMTQDFPYSVSCFRATPIQSPGQHVGAQQGMPARP